MNTNKKIASVAIGSEVAITEDQTAFYCTYVTNPNLPVKLAYPFSTWMFTFTSSECSLLNQVNYFRIKFLLVVFD